MRVTFFGSDGFLQPMLDRRLIQFTAGTENPVPPVAFIQEHFKQAVLANMRGAGQIPNLDYDETEDAQSMATFEAGEGREWFETRLAEKLIAGVDDKDLERYSRPTAVT